MENPTFDVLTKLRSEIDSAMTTLSTAKEQKTDIKKQIEAVRESNALQMIIDEARRAIADAIADRDDLISDYELTIDYGNTVEIESYDINPNSIGSAVEDTLKVFVEEIFCMISTWDA